MAFDVNQVTVETRLITNFGVETHSETLERIITHEDWLLARKSPYFYMVKV